MSLTFPTQPARSRSTVSPPGQPTRAHHCRCVGGPRVDAADASCPTCIQCGRYTRETINTTWQNRAREIAARRHPK